MISQDPESGEVALSSSKLHSYKLSDAGKRQRIESYIQSQKGYMSVYAAEGKVTRTTWDRPNSSPSPNPDTHLQRHSIFETPILKPRVPERDPDRMRSSTESVSIMKDSDKENRAPRVEMTQNAKTRRSTGATRGKEVVASTDTTENLQKRKHESSRTKAQQSTLEAFVKHPNEIRNQSNKKRPHSPDADAERSARKCAFFLKQLSTLRHFCS